MGRSHKLAAFVAVTSLCLAGLIGVVGDNNATTTAINNNNKSTKTAGNNNINSSNGSVVTSSRVRNSIGSSSSKMTKVAVAGNVSSKAVVVAAQQNLTATVAAAGKLIEMTTISGSSSSVSEELNNRKQRTVVLPETTSPLFASSLFSSTMRGKTTTSRYGGNSYKPHSSNRWSKASFENYSTDGIITFYDNATESDIKQMLLHYYDRTSRPVFNDNEPIKVKVGFSLYNILDTNEKFHTISTLLSIRLRWRDNFLRWRSNRVKSLYIPTDRIWVPDIVFANSAEATNGYITTNAIISSDGDILWMFPILLKSQCIFQVFFFPFDCQKCKIVLISWTYNGRQVDLSPDPADNNAVYYNPRNQEWFVDKINVSRNVVIYECCPNDTFPDVTFTIYLRRRSQFYVLNLIYPCVLFYILSFLGFLLPLESGDKVNMEVTVLLSLVVFMMFVNDMLPPTSELLPAIGMIVVTTMIEVVLALVMAVAVTYCAHRNVSPENIPFVFRWILENYGNAKVVRRYRQALLDHRICDGGGGFGGAVLKTTVEKKPSPVFGAAHRRFVPPSPTLPPISGDISFVTQRSSTRQPSIIVEEPPRTNNSSCSSSCSTNKNDRVPTITVDEVREPPPPPPSSAQQEPRPDNTHHHQPSIGIFVNDGVRGMIAQSFHTQTTQPSTSSDEAGESDDMFINDHTEFQRRKNYRNQQYWIEIARILDRVFLFIFGIVSGSVNIFLYLIMLGDESAFDIFAKKGEKTD